MRYLPHTDEEIASMLGVIGTKSLDDLFSAVPQSCRRTRGMNLPEPLSEWDLGRLMEGLSSTMAASPEYKVYTGAGSYEHYIPQVVPYLLGRSEFVTSYTPYQPEISQGTLQAIYEYQTLSARLLGMEVSNASMYDGASALAEAVLMAIRITKKRRVAVSRLVHPHFRRVVQTYLAPTDYQIVELPYLPDGRTDLSSLRNVEGLAALAVQSPNFFGVIEDLKESADRAHDQGALFISTFTEPLAYGILKSPGSLGADIASGEGQSLGIPQSFGGPGLGMFATRMSLVRNMPGRLVGKTVDAEGRQGFVLTLATREQHIRREKATSNICTNNSLCAVAATMYMACLGASGIRELSQLNHDKAEYLKDRLSRSGCKVSFGSPTFNEFVMETPPDFEKTFERLLERKIVAGLSLATYYPELENHYLFCATETKSREDMDRLAKEIAS
jgi:glycine cleavage system P protein (glycine dehydrogenase) subunit 1